jgi:ketosteroid isomerase-like protein
MEHDPALVTLLRYFDALERYDVDEALSYFSDKCEYNHPPYSWAHPGHDDDLEWHCARGHDELRALWAIRGPFEAKHHVTAFARNGDVCFNEAYASLEDNDQYASWVSVFTVDDDDKIVKYLSYTNMPRLPILGSESPIILGD